MCRFLVFRGVGAALLADLITKPTHSLVSQTHQHYLPRAKSQNLQARNVHLNGDGFGIGFYSDVRFCFLFLKIYFNNFKSSFAQRLQSSSQLRQRGTMRI